MLILSTARYAPRPLQVTERPPSGSHFRTTPASSHKVKELHNAQSAGVSVFPGRHLPGVLPWMRKHPKTLPQSSRNGHLETRSSSALQWTRWPLSSFSSPVSHVGIMEPMLRAPFPQLRGSARPTTRAQDLRGTRIPQRTPSQPREG